MGAIRFTGVNSSVDTRGIAQALAGGNKQIQSAGRGLSRLFTELDTDQVDERSLKANEFINSLLTEEAYNKAFDSGELTESSLMAKLGGRLNKDVLVNARGQQQENRTRVAANLTYTNQQRDIKDKPYLEQATAKLNSLDTYEARLQLLKDMEEDPAYASFSKNGMAKLNSKFVNLEQQDFFTSRGKLIANDEELVAADLIEKEARAKLDNGESEASVRRWFNSSISNIDGFTSAEARKNNLGIGSLDNYINKRNWMSEAEEEGLKISNVRLAGQQSEDMSPLTANLATATSNMPVKLPSFMSEDWNVSKASAVSFIRENVKMPWFSKKKGTDAAHDYYQNKVNLQGYDPKLALDALVASTEMSNFIIGEGFNDTLFETNYKALKEQYDLNREQKTTALTFAQDAITSMSNLHNNQAATSRRDYLNQIRGRTSASEADKAFKKALSTVVPSAGFTQSTDINTENIVPRIGYNLLGANDPNSGGGRTDILNGALNTNTVLPEAPIQRTTKDVAADIIKSGEKITLGNIDAISVSASVGDSEIPSINASSTDSLVQQLYKRLPATQQQVAKLDGKMPLSSGDQLAELSKQGLDKYDSLSGPEKVSFYNKNKKILKPALEERETSNMSDGNLAKLARKAITYQIQGKGKSSHKKVNLTDSQLRSIKDKFPGLYRKYVASLIGEKPADSSAKKAFMRFLRG